MPGDVAKLIAKLALLALPTLGVLGGIEYKLQTIPTVYEAKRDGIESNLDRIQLVALGSSEQYNAVDPDDLSLFAYNLADTSQSIFYDSQLLEKYLPRMKSLRFVVISVSYFTLFYDLADSPEDWRAFFYLRYYGIDSDENGPIHTFDLRRYSYLARYGGIEAFRFLLRHKPTTSTSERGWEDSGTATGDLGPKEAAKRADFHNAIAKLEHFDGNVVRVTELIERLRAQHVEPILMTLPVYDTYYTRLDPVRVNAMRKTLETLSRKYGVTYLNFMRDSRFIDADFRDVDHLNATGAHKLSKLLDATLRRSVGDR